jgi:hypothetical protein
VVLIRTLLGSLLIFVALEGCGPSKGQEPPEPFLLRVVCSIQRWLERHDFRVRGPDVGRCDEAARQIDEGRERAEHVLRDAMEPAPGGGEGEERHEPPVPSP